jgi:GT2 family glycosyltransferase
MEQVRKREAPAPSPIAATLSYGRQPESPTVSIVVPLYKRVEFLEYQVGQLVLDPAMREHELIYVLDSPEQTEWLRTYARQIYELYRLPFRLVFLSQNLGFAGANNAAASVAHGRLLVLLNSDVLPAAPGWVSRMASFYDATPAIGALGVKLLYEDDTIQHAGLYFRRRDEAAPWENQHYFKGFERDFRAANLPRKVPAVTAACLMIAKELFDAQQGLRGVYVRGDYEDSDLCLRLLAAGFDNWYLPDVELYHLEGQSYGWTDRAGASRYNAWTHTKLWNDDIAAVMERFAPTDTLP